MNLNILNYQFKSWKFVLITTSLFVKKSSILVRQSTCLQHSSCVYDPVADSFMLNTGDFVTTTIKNIDERFCDFQLHMLKKIIFLCILHQRF